MNPISTPLDPQCPECCLKHCTTALGLWRFTPHLQLSPSLLLSHMYNTVSRRYMILTEEAKLGYDTDLLRLECIAVLEHRAPDPAPLRDIRKNFPSTPLPDHLPDHYQERSFIPYLGDIQAHLIEAAREAPTPSLTARISELSNITTLIEIVHELISDYFPSPQPLTE